MGNAKNVEEDLERRFGRTNARERRRENAERWCRRPPMIAAFFSLSLAPKEDTHTTTPTTEEREREIRGV
tara:strand:+ start:126 stop:335 length:210 start_codon:yes stop_codon:yes gene_type:complete